MKIAIITAGYPTPKYLGTGIFEFDQAKALAGIGHEVVFLTVDLRSIRRWRKWGRESLEKEGIPIEGINIPLGRLPKWFLRVFGTWGLGVVYKAAIKKYGKPDIIHPHFTGVAYNSVKALKKYNVPIVMTEHSSAINKTDIPRQLRRMASFTYKNVDQIIVVSPALKERLKTEFSAESVFVPNIVDLSIFSMSEEQPEKDSLFRIVSVGNLIPLKRMNLLIKAFSIFVKEHPSSVLEIFGGGPERTSLESLVKELGITNSVILRGSTPRKDIAETMKQASCFALASSSETFGVAYVEALACGVPVIATRCGGPEGFVHDGNGLLIPVDDEVALIKALETMYDTVDKYNREKIVTETKEKFSPEAVAKHLEQVYKNVAR